MWLNSYINTLSRKDRTAIRTYRSRNKFRFGNGALFPSEYNVLIPVYIGHNKYKLSVDVVKCNIPLLLSRETLKRANAKIDIGRAARFNLFLRCDYTFNNLFNWSYVSYNQSTP